MYALNIGFLLLQKLQSTSPSQKALVTPLYCILDKTEAQLHK